MKIAVASSDFTKVSGHAGRARKWLLFQVAEDGAISPPSTLELEADMVFHYVEDDRPHPLDQFNAVLALSAGEGFLKHMEKRGVDAVLTAESDPAKAVADYLAKTLSPPKPRPIGSLLCKTLDLFSKHK